MDADLFHTTLQTITSALHGKIQQRDWFDSWRDRRIAELQTAMAERLKAEQTILQGYERHLAQLRQTATTAKPASELMQVLEYLKGQEIRATIKATDPVLLRGEYESKLADPSGQWDDWLSAVEESPIPLLPNEILDRGRESRHLRRLPPEVRQQISDLTEIAEAHRHFVNLVRRELPAPDPVAELAAGSRDA